MLCLAVPLGGRYRLQSADAEIEELDRPSILASCHDVGRLAQW